VRERWGSTCHVCGRSVRKYLSPLRLPAFEWGAKIAAARRCSQEVRRFQYDPAS